MGRPQKYPHDHPVWDEIFADIASGMSLREACEVPGRPSRRTFLYAVMGGGGDSDLARRYRLASQLRADGYADEIVEIADRAAGCDAAGVNAARLAVDARKWVAARLVLAYRDRQEVEMSGSLSIEKMSDDDLNRKIAQLMSKAGGGDPG